MGIDRIDLVDGYKFEYEWDGLEVTRRLSQPGSDLVLENNAQLRKDPLKDGDLGRWALSMEEIDRMQVAVWFPDINSHDSQERHNAWRKFMNDGRSLPYRVREHI